MPLWRPLRIHRIPSLLKYSGCFGVRHMLEYDTTLSWWIVQKHPVIIKKTHRKIVQRKEEVSVVK